MDQKMLALLRHDVRQFNRERNSDPIDLSGADLRAVEMPFADLRDVDLRGADLRGAMLNGAALTRACLASARMDEAEFDGATFRQADLGEATLCGSSLRYARFYASTLAGADLSYSIVGGTGFEAVDLSQVLGLSKVRHHRPSSVGVDTLFLSREALPVDFVLRCGVPVAAIQLVMDTGPLEGDYFEPTFISYSTLDSEFVDKLYRTLTDCGVPCWLDKHQLFPGDNIERRIDIAISEQATRVLLVCSKSSLSDVTGWWVDREVSRALEREHAHQVRTGQPVSILIPLDIDGFLFGPECSYYRREDLKRRLAWRSPSAGGVPESAVQRVVEALRVGGPRRPTFGEPRDGEPSE